MSVSDLEHLCDLLFEVSNEDRLRILQRLRGEALNVTSLSRETDLSTQETSRHLSRLSEAGLTLKDPEGLHHLTPYGTLVLRQLGATGFVSRHRDYFISHTLGSFPDSLVSRMGELEGCTFIDNVMVTVHRVEEILMEAEEYICNINVPYIASAFPLIRDSFERGVEGRFIRTREVDIPEVMRDERDRFIDEETVNRFRSQGVYEARFLEEPDLVLYMSEKEVAILSFPTTEGRFDLLGFSSSDEAAHAFCRDIFTHYWELARPVV